MNVYITNAVNRIVDGLNSISAIQKEESRDKANTISVVSNLPQLSIFHHQLKTDKFNEVNKVYNFEENIEFIFNPSIEDSGNSGYYSQILFYNWLKIIDSVTEENLKKGLFVNIIV